MGNHRIRPVARCVFQRNGRILVVEVYDTVKAERFYVPLGGRIEFGEYGQQTIRRELREELNAEVADLRLLGFVENVFTYEGRAGHEIVLIFDGRLVDESMYERERIECLEPEAEIGSFTAVWKALDDFGAGQPPLYPTGLLELLRARQTPSG